MRAVLELGSFDKLQNYMKYVHQYAHVTLIRTFGAIHYKYIKY